MKKYNLSLFCCTRCSLGKDQELRFYTRWDLDELRGIAAETKEEAKSIALERLKGMEEIKKYNDLFGGAKEYKEDSGSLIYDISPGKRAGLCFRLEFKDGESRPGCRNIVSYCGKSEETSKIIYQEFFRRVKRKKGILGYSSETEIIRKDEEGRVWNDVFLHLDENPDNIPIFP